MRRRLATKRSCQHGRSHSKYGGNLLLFGAHTCELKPGSYVYSYIDVDVETRLENCGHTLF